VARHCTLARQIGKPIVLEEFGMTRDGGAVDAASATAARDSFFSFLSELLLDQYRAGSPLAGSNFWTWGGERHAMAPFAPGALSDQAPGEPPHEPEGLNAVYDTDTSTLAVLRDHALAVARAPGSLHFT
jgi:mannan endo-1,4-beta-mannosidase